MKELLLAIKSELRAKMSDVRDRSIFITEADDALPDEIRLPAIAIKDGDVENKELGGNMMQYTMNVRVLVWVDSDDMEVAIIGSSSRKGVLDLEKEVHKILDENLLNITGMQSAVRDNISPESELLLFGKEDADARQRKTIFYKYVKEEERP